MEESFKGYLDLIQNTLCLKKLIMIDFCSKEGYYNNLKTILQS